MVMLSSKKCYGDFTIRNGAILKEDKGDLSVYLNGESPAEVVALLRRAFVAAGHDLNTVAEKLKYGKHWVFGDLQGHGRRWPDAASLRKAANPPRLLVIDENSDDEMVDENGDEGTNTFTGSSALGLFFSSVNTYAMRYTRSDITLADLNLELSLRGLDYKLYRSEVDRGEGDPAYDVCNEDGDKLATLHYDKLPKTDYIVEMVQAFSRLYLVGYEAGKLARSREIAALLGLQP